MFAWNFLYSSLCLLPLPVTEKGLAPLSLLPPVSFCTYRWYILTCSLLHTKQSISYPLIIFVTLFWAHSSMSMSLLYWGAQNSTQRRCGAPRKEGSPPSTGLQSSAYCSPEDCSYSLLPGCLVTSCCFGVHQEPRTFFCQSASQMVGPPPVFPLLNFMRLLLAHFSSLLW